MPALGYVFLLLLHVLIAMSMNLPKGNEKFILTNRDVNGTFALSLNPAAEPPTLSMRNVSTGITIIDQWYQANVTSGNEYNDTILQFADEGKYYPQYDDTWQISARGLFLGLDDGNTTRPMLHPLSDFGKSGYGYWSVIPLPVVTVTRTIWRTASTLVAAKTSFLGGRVTSISTLSVTETQVCIPDTLSGFMGLRANHCLLISIMSGGQKVGYQCWM